MHDLQLQAIRRRLERVLIAFFALVTLSFVVIFVVDPAVYAQVLSLPSSAAPYPLPVTLFLVGILVLITVLIVGVRRHWRWVFWIILLAFGAAVLDIPVTLLQLAGALPQLFPDWYSWYRLGIACVQVVIAVWMLRIAYYHGAWARGRKKRAVTLQADELDESGVHPLH